MGDRMPPGYASNRHFLQEYLPGQFRDPRAVALPLLHRLIVQPDSGLTPIFKAIQGAHLRIRVKIFDLSEPTIVAALCEAHKRGIDVRVLLNHTRADGSKANQESFAILEQAGVSVRWTPRHFAITHEKSMIVDDGAYICTFNFSRKCFEKNRGYAIFTRQPTEVAEIVACFEADWKRDAFVPSGQLFWSGSSSHKTRSVLCQFLDEAHMEILVQHKKLVDSLVLDRLLDAKARGVSVRFLSSGHKGVHREDLYENAANLRILVRAGVQVHQLRRPQIHTKLIVVDGQKALLGSLNLARSCFEERRELGIFLREDKLLRKLVGTFERDWLHSQPFVPEDPLLVQSP